MARHRIVPERSRVWIDARSSLLLKVEPDVVGRVEIIAERED